MELGAGWGGGFKIDFLRNTLSTHLSGNLVEMNEMIVRECSFHSIPS